MQIALPLVSVVISNFNYGRFLRDAIESVRAQTYEAVECIVVDDASTDDSAVVLDALAVEWPDLVVLRHATNAGQGAASATGFAASRGHYVVFMDADDLLFPEFVATHVYVHLSARRHPGLTSSDVVQVVDGRAVLTTGQALNDRLMEDRLAGAGSGGPPGHAFRPLARAPAGPWTLPGPAPALLDDLVSVPPGQVRWCWSPGTANMFRRDAVALFADAPELAATRIGSDAFLCIAVGHRCGGVLIDRALSVYRIHGGNVGTAHPQLANVRCMKPDSEPSDAVVAALIELYTREAVAMVPRFWSVESYTGLLERLDTHLAGGGRRDTLAAALARNRAAVVQALGPERLATWTTKRRKRWFKRWLRRRRT
ncbi:glycosyltransferase family A protein [Rhodoplanes sp. TEM]|uniref:Glycosyltransferase family A protein n=1 Tax=Rhodoplanes tepidamans TaxID=200616 RepID=A0ABT5JAZ5_RHOTP|nr:MULTISPECIES: glycosyltransferase family A protein [Rhodoplanes]MDC7786856.1 glycosyltransferase family A protein [Rhodoplanes tepidamans]MDC7984215.1 glycosyltransferase family A protein [Rhodoplanes sp. TEM]MDQ0355984.1 glycosyltransferase involved in cell wall biosynthesis [Rhodoplanes tepidamans]